MATIISSLCNLGLVHRPMRCRQISRLPSPSAASRNTGIEVSLYYFASHCSARGRQMTPIRHTFYRLETITLGLEIGCQLHTHWRCRYCQTSPNAPDPNIPWGTVARQEDLASSPKRSDAGMHQRLQAPANTSARRQHGSQSARSTCG